MQPLAPGQFLRTVVYPRLDAVDKNLLDGLNPKQLGTSGAYPLTCPECKAPEAYYYPQSAFINCPRKKECGVSTSIWDAMLSTGYSQKEIFSILCDAAGVEPPSREKNNSAGEASSVASSSAELSIGQAVFRITQGMAASNASILADFQKERGYTDAQMKEMKLGYYTSPEELVAELAKLQFTKEEAAALGYIEYDESAPEKLWSGLAGKVIGYWPHPDGSIRLWGRLPVGSGSKRNPKYKFAPSLKKDIPYLFSRRKPTTLTCVEGTFDAWALQLCDVWGAAIGGASINKAQALYLATKGVSEVNHMVDGDSAGWEGAVASIRNCEGCGIVTNVIALGSGMDDPDALVRSGRSSELLKLIEGRINAGRYLALMLSAEVGKDSLDLQAINRIYAAAQQLTPHSRAAFESQSSLLGVRVDLEAEAARVFSGLILNGMSFEQARSVVLRQTGYTITISKESNDG